MFEEVVNLNVKIDGDNVTLSRKELEQTIEVLKDKGADTWWATPINIARFLQEDIIDKAPEKEKLIKAMRATGYEFDSLSSSDGYLCFYREGCCQINEFHSWDEVAKWLNSVVSDYPRIAQRVDDILHGRS